MDVIKSSRFWLALIILSGALALALVGRITGSEAIATMLGILGGFGVAKTGIQPVKVIVPFLFISVIGCSTQNLAQNLEQAHHSVKAATIIAEATFHKTCEQIAKDCGKAKDTTCIKWHACNKKRAIFLESMIGIQKNLATANSILDITEK